MRWDYRGQRQLVPLGQWMPKVAVDAYVAPEAVLAGQVTVYDGASVWSGAVLRGDLNKITLGFCANVQERCVLHAAWSAPTGLSPSPALPIPHPPSPIPPPLLEPCLVPRSDQQVNV